MLCEFVTAKLIIGRSNQSEQNACAALGRCRQNVVATTYGFFSLILSSPAFILAPPIHTHAAIGWNLNISRFNQFPPKSFFLCKKAVSQVNQRRNH